MRRLREGGLRGVWNLRGVRMEACEGRKLCRLRSAGEQMPRVREEGKMREGKIVAFFAGLFVFAVGAVVAVSVFVCLVN